MTSRTRFAPPTTALAAGLLAAFLLVTSGLACNGSRNPSAAAVDAGPADDLPAEALVGTWVWDWGGTYGIDENAMRTQLEIGAVQEDGTLTGTETFSPPQGETFTWELAAATARREGGHWRVDIERGIGDEATSYRLTLIPPGDRLNGHFEKGSWTTDEAVFEKWADSPGGDGDGEDGGEGDAGGGEEAADDDT